MPIKIGTILLIALITKIDGWIDEVITSVSGQMISCQSLTASFEGFYSHEFLSSCYYVGVGKIPKPDFPEMRQLGFGGFIHLDLAGITFKNCYFLKFDHLNDLELHLHELVHVHQWQILGARSFIERYMLELLQYGYDEAPLEKMAYELSNYYAGNGTPIDVNAIIRKKLVE